MWRDWSARRAGAALLCAVLLFGCASAQHVLDASKFAGEPLSLRQARGAERLRAEVGVDPSVADYVKEHGRPDYLYIVDRHKLYLFYVSEDRAAKFERVLIEPSTVTELGRIPGSLLKQLPRQVQQQLERQRSVAQRRAQALSRRSRAAQARSAPRPAPGARAPDGTYMGAFEASAIVSRMREPVTAADPGVDAWRRSQLRGGGTAWTANAGRTQYEVSANRVTFTHPVSSSKRLPARARIAIQRVNNAVFAARAGRVTEVALDLAEQVMADPSGRTARERRLAGRTIRVGRLAGRGLFAYSVHP